MLCTIIPNRKGDSDRVPRVCQAHRPDIHRGRGLYVYDYYIITCGACVVRRFVVWRGRGKRVLALMT